MGMAQSAATSRQAAMSAAAYAAVLPLWRGVGLVEPSHDDSDALKALRRRLLTRAELQVITTRSEAAVLTLIAAQARIGPRRQQQAVVLEPDAVRKLPPGNFLAMGTNGLQPTEARAVLHALQVRTPTCLQRPCSRECSLSHTTVRAPRSNLPPPGPPPCATPSCFAPR